jgi:hypothetical protein
MREANRRGENLVLTEEELAFYDALEVNDSAVKVLGDEILRTIARELVVSIKKKPTIDWTIKESVRANPRSRSGPRRHVASASFLVLDGYRVGTQADRVRDDLLDNGHLLVSDFILVNCDLLASVGFAVVFVVDLLEGALDLLVNFVHHVPALPLLLVVGISRDVALEVLHIGKPSTKPNAFP